jgi:hypothetical protein
MRTHLSLLLMSLLALAMTGCATRTATVIDTSSDWVRLAKPARARVQVYEGKGVWRDAGTMLLPQGWVAGPGPKGNKP